MNIRDLSYELRNLDRWFAIYGIPGGVVMIAAGVWYLRQRYFYNDKTHLLNEAAPHGIVYLALGAFLWVLSLWVLFARPRGRKLSSTGRAVGR